ncbi:MAG: ATP--guanido phosphotransferase [Christensenellaceae bacterium]
MDCFDTVFVSSRIRIARNFAAYPFPHRLQEGSVADEIILSVYRALRKEDKFRLYRMRDLSEAQRQYLIDSNKISYALLARPEISAALINEDGSVSVMINEEDHLRQQYFSERFDLWKDYEVLMTLDEKLSSEICYAYDEQLGYLTACPTNLGTGLRCSVMLFLPGITLRGGVERLRENMRRFGFALRGMFGEGSAALGAHYQLSNEVTLGSSEKELLQEVNGAVMRITKYEMEERSALAEDADALRDRVCRSLGVLQRAKLMSYADFLERAADAALGVATGILTGITFRQIERLVVAMRPGVLFRHGWDRTQREEDLVRARKVAEAFSAVKEDEHE